MQTRAAPLSATLLAVACLVAHGCGGHSPGSGDGTGDTGDSCASHADCSGDLFCDGPNEPQVCGIPPMEQCASDTDCPVGDRCHAVPDTCSPDGQGSTCRAPCTAGLCGPGFRCNANGACEATPCDDGFTCNAPDVCDYTPAPADPVHAQTNGCTKQACSSDDECSGLRCTNGICQTDLGSCQEDTPVP